MIDDHHVIKQILTHTEQKAVTQNSRLLPESLAPPQASLPSGQYKPAPLHSWLLPDESSGGRFGLVVSNRQGGWSEMWTFARDHRIASKIHCESGPNSGSIPVVPLVYIPGY